MGDDLIPILTRFHREVVLPDVTGIVSEAVGNLEERMNAHFDAIDKRFDKLETEYQSEPSHRGSETADGDWKPVVHRHS